MSSMKVRKGEKLCAICKSAVILESRKNCSYCLNEIEEKKVIKIKEQAEVNRSAEKAEKSISYVDYVTVVKKVMPHRGYHQYFYVVNMFDGEDRFVELHKFARYPAMWSFLMEVREVYGAKIDFWL